MEIQHKDNILQIFQWDQSSKALILKHEFHGKSFYWHIESDISRPRRWSMGAYRAIDQNVDFSFAAQKNKFRLPEGEYTILLNTKVQNAYDGKEFFSFYLFPIVRAKLFDGGYNYTTVKRVFDFLYLVGKSETIMRVDSILKATPKLLLEISPISFDT